MKKNMSLILLLCLMLMSQFASSLRAQFYSEAPVTISGNGEALSDLVYVKFRATGVVILGSNYSTTNGDAIKWAIDKNTSTKSHPHNKGKGFDNLIEFIKSNRSIMYIYSNSAIFMVSKGEGRQFFFDNNIKNFKGTAIQMEIYVDNLPDNDNLIEDFWEQLPS